MKTLAHVFDGKQIGIRYNKNYFINRISKVVFILLVPATNAVN